MERYTVSARRRGRGCGSRSRRVVQEMGSVHRSRWPGHRSARATPRGAPLPDFDEDVGRRSRAASALRAAEDAGTRLVETRRRRGRAPPGPPSAARVRAAVALAGAAEVIWDTVRRDRTKIRLAASCVRRVVGLLRSIPRRLAMQCGGAGFLISLERALGDLNSGLGRAAARRPQPRPRDWGRGENSLDPGRRRADCLAIFVLPSTLPPLPKLPVLRARPWRRRPTKRSAPRAFASLAPATPVLSPPWRRRRACCAAAAARAGRRRAAAAAAAARSRPAQSAGSLSGRHRGRRLGGARP